MESLPRRDPAGGGGWYLLVLIALALAYAFGILSIKGDDSGAESWFARYEE